MKRILFLAFLTLAVAGLVVSLTKPPASAAPAQMGGGAEDAIKKLEQERNQAIVHGDTAALDRMSSADYTVINEWGQLSTKAQILDAFKSGAIKFESREQSDLNVRVYGNAAVVTGRSTQKAQQDGKEMSAEQRYTRVYVKEKGNWIAVASQITAIAK